MAFIRPRLLLCASALLLPLSVACERTADEADTDAAADAPPAAVTAGTDRFVAGWNDNDAAALAALYAEDATARAADETYRGRTEIEQDWIRPNIAVVSNLQLTSTSSQQSGSDWHDEGTYSHLTSPPDIEPFTADGRYTLVWTQNASGGWQIRSSDVQPNQPPQN